MGNVFLQPFLDRTFEVKLFIMLLLAWLLQIRNRPCGHYGRMTTNTRLGNQSARLY